MRLIDQFWAAKALLSNSSGGRFFKNFLSKYLNCVFYASLILSFIGVVLFEVLECQPFTHYWQVVPDPGTSCRQSYGQLFTMGGFDILTEIFLIALPLPLIIEAKLSRKAKLESLVLMLFPLVSIGFTAYRLPNTVSSGHLGAQRYRTLMASLDILLSTAAANALVVTSFLQGRGFKKTRTYRYPKVDEPVENKATLVEQQHQVEEGGMELTALSPKAGLRLSTRSLRDDRYLLAARRNWGIDADIMRDDTPLGDSPPASPASKRVTWMSNVTNDMSVPAADDCSERSTTRLSPYPQVQTTISTDKAAQSGAEATDAAGELAIPERVRRSSTPGGILVETTWHVNVSSFSRPRRGNNSPVGF